MNQFGNEFGLGNLQIPWKVSLAGLQNVRLNIHAWRGDNRENYYRELHKKCCSRTKEMKWNEFLSRPSLCSLVIWLRLPWSRFSALSFTFFLCSRSICSWSAVALGNLCWSFIMSKTRQRIRGYAPGPRTRLDPGARMNGPGQGRTTDSLAPETLRCLAQIWLTPRSQRCVWATNAYGACATL